jgi:putative ABC transport system permease protein
MSGIDIVRTAIGNSLRSRLRTTLTVLAIFIGAFTLTITSAIGTGVSNYIDTQIGAFGAKDVLSITKTAKDAPPANAGPAAYDPDDAVTGGDLGRPVTHVSSLFELYSCRTHTAMGTDNPR